MGRNYLSQVFLKFRQDKTEEKKLMLFLVVEDIAFSVDLGDRLWKG